jgi:hypothetical protein
MVKRDYRKRGVGRIACGISFVDKRLEEVTTSFREDRWTEVEEDSVEIKLKGVVWKGRTKCGK